MRKWNDPAWMLVPIVIVMIFSIIIGLVEPLMHRGNFADCKSVWECYQRHSDEIEAE